MQLDWKYVMLTKVVHAKVVLKIGHVRAKSHDNNDLNNKRADTWYVEDCYKIIVFRK